jgi:hypothetical protein
MRAAYHRTDAAPRVYDCRPGEAPGTVDLLDAEGAVLVRGCPVAEEPGDGVAVLSAPSSGPEPEKPAPRKRSPKAPSPVAEGAD